MPPHGGAPAFLDAMNRTGLFTALGVILLFALLAPLALWDAAKKIPPQRPATITTPAREDDATLVRSLLAQDLSARTFAFADVVRACAGKAILPLDDSPAHKETTTAIGRALDETLAALNKEDSPVRALRRINEASRFFEDGIHARMNATPGFRCEVPPTVSGDHQRTGYPDLRITHIASGKVFYLDPKLVETGSEASTFRTFYFEPKSNTLKITDDAVHLLVGIFHDGATRRWTFTGWKLVDLSQLRVRLKAEFQASNADLYGK